MISFCNNPQLTKNSIISHSLETRPPQIIPFNFSLIPDVYNIRNNTDKDYLKELCKDIENLCSGCLTHKKEAIKDHTRAESYCSVCGHVLSMSYPYVGGNLVSNPLSYNYYTEENIYYMD